tara:strand:+ start:2888 stop:3100 length:213 start_codon:yes stop_codon:yes gene_type:complete
LIGSLTKAFGFSLDEVRHFTLGQVVRYMRAMPEIMPLINPFAKAPEKPLTGEAAITSLQALGVKRVNKNG